MLVIAPLYLNNMDVLTSEHLHFQVRDDPKLLSDSREVSTSK